MLCNSKGNCTGFQVERLSKEIRINLNPNDPMDRLNQQQQCQCIVATFHLKEQLLEHYSQALLTT